MSEFLKSNPAIDKAVSEATNFEDMREAMLQTLAKQGTIMRDKRDAFGVRVLRPPEQEPEPNAALPASGFKFEHEFKYHPNSGRRSVMLRANTQQDLNDLIREMEKTV